MCEALTFLLDNIYIRFDTKLFRQTLGIPMDTYCAPLIADLFLFWRYWSSTSRYLDDLLNIDNNYFDGLISQIYPSELQLNKANSSETEVPFLDLHLSILDRFISCKIYDKRDDFDLRL